MKKSIFTLVLALLPCIAFAQAPLTTQEWTRLKEFIDTATPAGELGGTWNAPTIDATHSGSSHAGIQAAAESTAAGALSNHEADTTAVHGIADTSVLETVTGSQGKVDTHSADTTSVHGITDTSALETTTGSQAKVDAHSADTTAVHGITDTSALETVSGSQAKVDTHVNDTSGAHAAFAVSVDSTTLVGTGTDAQTVFEELDNAIVAAGTHLSGTGAPGASTGDGQVAGKTDYYDSTSKLVYDLTDATGGANVWRLRGNVNAAAALTSTAFTTGGGTTALQTPSATSTLDASGNAVFAGTLTADSMALGGVTGSCDGTAGCVEFVEGTAPSGAPTANSIREYAPADVTTAYGTVKPAAGATGLMQWTYSATGGPGSSPLATQSIVNTFVKSIWFGAGSLDGDGTQCPAAPTTVTINSGPKIPTFICTDNDAATLYGAVRMPDSWNGGTVTFTHVYIQTAADTGVLNGDIACQARSNGEVPSSTYGTEIAIDDAAVVGSNSNDMATSAAVTCAGTGLAGGDMLYFRYQLDAGGTTTAVATLHHVGFNMEYTVTGLTD